MRVTLRIDGGLAYLPGLARPRTLDLDTLPAPERERICALIDAARGQARHDAASRAPDARTYTIDVENGARSTSFALTEPFADEHCARLVEALRAHLR
ncbi:MAG TPA: protealysin inhibitor emfourin [Casimicrobiaceae bacterium]|nr:protealysin inhibitor emfourin [Casimicrobiaceae bacterium]